MSKTTNIINLEKLSLSDVPLVGGKNASLGEMISNLSKAGVKVPGGFATTAEAYRQFLKENDLVETIQALLATLKEGDTKQLAEVGSKIRAYIKNAPLPKTIESDIREAYKKMCDDAGEDVVVAVRSSATAEDLPDSSFAGQQETYLNICGSDSIIEAVHLVYASLFTDRAVSYRRHRGYGNDEVALSVTVQKMIRSDLATSGVMFTLDTESGFDDVVFITAAYGLGESVVQGLVNPDEFYVYKPAITQNRERSVIRRRLGDKMTRMIFNTTTSAGNSVQIVENAAAEINKFCLSDDELIALSKIAMTIEKHYGRHMDIEWAKDGIDGHLYIVQARPETVNSNQNEQGTSTRYIVHKKNTVLAEGRAIGQKIGVGRARLVYDIADMDTVQDGDVLVTDMTDPDWEPVMKRARAIVTRRGGRTCHAAIIARELGVPAVVGCGNTVDNIKEGSDISVSCAEGDTGYIYDGIIDYSQKQVFYETTSLPLKLQVNIANPDTAFSCSRLPVDGVGLARLEFIIARSIGFHPRCALDYDTLPEDTKKAVNQRALGYASAKDFYIDKLEEGISMIAAAFSPRSVIFRFSDFKSNEYAGLIGGNLFEPTEENPMLGFRGASRYNAPNFYDCFALECEAMKRVRNKIGLDNVWLMVPFVRTPAEAKSVIETLEKNGISKKDGWTIIMMCEVPSNVLLADKFLQYFDGFSIGSNDLTQFTLALDRDSELVASIFDERNEAVKIMISQAIAACLKEGKYIGICGQAPSDYPEFAKWLMDEKISAISLNSDAILETRMSLAQSL